MQRDAEIPKYYQTCCNYTVLIKGEIRALTPLVYFKDIDKGSTEKIKNIMKASYQPITSTNFSRLTCKQFATTAVFAGLSALSVLEVGAHTSAPRSGTKLSHAEAARRLSAAGITSSSSGGCTNKNNPHCTSFDGVLSGTVDTAITLRHACKCNLVITGGTEVGHASGTYSHANGYKLDFKKTSTLNSYVKDSFTKIGNRGDGYPQWKSAAGNIYCV